MTISGLPFLEGNFLRMDFSRDARVVVPDMTIAYDTSSHVIEAHCLARRRLMIQSDAFPAAEFVRRANAAGTVTLDLDAVGKAPLSGGDVIFTSCWTKAGDELSNRHEVP